MKLRFFLTTLITFSAALTGCSSEPEGGQTEVSSKERSQLERKDKLQALVNKTRKTNTSSTLSVELNGSEAQVITDSELDSKIERSLAEKSLQIGLKITENSKTFITIGRGVMAAQLGTTQAQDECVATSGLQALKTFSNYFNTSIKATSDQRQDSVALEAKLASSLSFLTKNGIEPFTYSASSQTNMTIVQGKPIDKSNEQIEVRFKSGPSCGYERNGDQAVWNCDVKLLASVFNSGLRSTNNALAINAIDSEYEPNQCVTAFSIQFN